jgi:hypothetical protein
MIKLYDLDTKDHLMDGIEIFCCCFKRLETNYITEILIAAVDGNITIKIISYNLLIHLD